MRSELQRRLLIVAGLSALAGLVAHGVSIWLVTHTLYASVGTLGGNSPFATPSSWDTIWEGVLGSLGTALLAVAVVAVGGVVASLVVQESFGATGSADLEADDDDPSLFEGPDDEGMDVG